MVVFHAPSVVVRRELLGQLSADRGGGVTLLTAPAGSGKTTLLRSWVNELGVRDRVAWVSVERGEQDAQHFWTSLIDELAASMGADAAVQRLEPTPKFDGESVLARLISELDSLQRTALLVIDDLHELRSPAALAQLELLLVRRPRLLRVVLATRHDPRLGLHRHRVAGELLEIRGADLRFTLEETQELLVSSGVRLPKASVALLHARTEGWAAGLRLAALSLAGHSDPQRFVAEFSGSERTVAGYLFAEVLERQPEQVRRLLLRTSLLERVNPALADALTGGSGSERMLQTLEEQNAFVAAIDTGRTWFRYHWLFADMLRLELRRTDPHTVPELHGVAADWYAQHGQLVEAVRHAQSAEDWVTAGRLLADHSFSLWLDGRGASVQALLAAFPARAVDDDAELARVFAGGAVWQGSLEDAQAYLALAERNAATVAEERRPRFEVALGITRLRLARRRGDFVAVQAHAQPLLTAAAPIADAVGLDHDVRASVLMHLGSAEFGSSRLDEAVGHLEQGLELARAGRRPYLEVQCLGQLAVAAGLRSFRQARACAMEAVAVAEAHGWAGDPATGPALAALGTVDVWQGRFEDAEQWVELAAHAVHPDVEPAAGLMLHITRGRLHAARGRLPQATGAFKAAAELETRLVGTHPMKVVARRLLAQSQVRLGDTAAARRTLDELGEEERDSATMRVALADAHLADGNAEAALALLTPAPDGSGAPPPLRPVEAFLLEAAAHHRLGEERAAESDVEQALELAEPDWLILPFVLTPTRDLLERHPWHRTAHAALLKDIRDVLAGSSPAENAGQPAPPGEELSESELRVLRYLPSNLSTAEIARELYLSFHTIKTHTRHVYAKLGAHSRTEAVERARERGLLGSSSRLR